MTGTEIFKRTATFEREASSLRLHAPQWKLLLAFDGQQTLAEIVSSAAIPFAEALPMAEKYLKNEWIAEQPITLDQYLKRTGASDLSALDSAIPPVTVLHEPKSDLLPPVSDPPSTASPVAQRATALLPRGPMKLNAIVDYIVSKADSVSLGQLLAYRVFLRVPPELLLAEEIVSVHLIGDNSLVRSEALQKAISGAVEETLQRPLPDSVFAAA